MLFRLEISRKFRDTVGSRPGFFRSGVTKACLNLEGRINVAKTAMSSEKTEEHRLMIAV